VLQVAGVHDSARYTSHVLMATDDACIDGYRRVAEVCHAQAPWCCRRSSIPAARSWSPAMACWRWPTPPRPSPNERFRVMPRELDQALIDEIVAGYAAAARRLHQAGLDGVEVVASHGYLPAQFLNPRVNRRSDGYNGDLDARLRFTREVLAAVRAATDDAFHRRPAHLRRRARSRGLTEDESLAAVQALQGELDYVHIVAGTSASLGGAIISSRRWPSRPPTGPGSRHLQGAPGHPAVRHRRINQPQEAELIARGQADVCGMTRALICDPQMPNKTDSGRAERARLHRLQPGVHRPLPPRAADLLHPAPGNRPRTALRPDAPASVRKRVLVVGGGRPA
jgi:2,4-dienoyl-CoA reductase-like NADH-dependent reductase (Old Yellow Enzyme family)